VQLSYRLSYYCYHYFFTSATLGTFFIFLAELGSFIVAFLIFLAVKLYNYNTSKNDDKPHVTLPSSKSNLIGDSKSTSSGSSSGSEKMGGIQRKGKQGAGVGLSRAGQKYDSQFEQEFGKRKMKKLG
jgi:hypothetical protein